ncbi:MAG TPA: O-antigen ligase family protein [Rhodopila sp.]|uniref:O-antigen ligase family protein n=1 Tax=Rhodopila sp. TaxID=2480087 RepID=UPI002CCAD95A|nr:O-antigen ligase family protein [Rhodopila sp.]HVY17030.1 O-antigen ligase family protein [Rhodopila sp.]
MLADKSNETVLLQATILLIVGLLAYGVLTPSIFPACLAGAAVMGVAGLALIHPTAFSAAWLVGAGMSLEMTLHDLVAPSSMQATIAVVKGAEIGLAALCALRFGGRLDLLNPVWAYAAMLGFGWAHGLYPGLTTGESLRSFIGSVAPFAFCFCRLPRDWPDAIIRATKWCPLIAVAACVPLAIGGWRPMFVDSGGARLAGLGHPAFLAGVCLPAIYACLIETYRFGRLGDVALLAANVVILMLTGARAPLAYAVGVIGVTLVAVPSSTFPSHARRLLLLLAACAAPVLALLADRLAGVRLFNIVATEAGDLSGRNLLWPWFETAAARSPWFGWGIGAGNVVIPSDGWIARLLHTWAAHNEYLRIEVEGGQIGLALLVLLFAGWVIRGTRGLGLAERRILRLVYVAFAAHAATDNVLISTPACVLFAFSTAVFNRLPLPDSVPRA